MQRIVELLDRIADDGGRNEKSRQKCQEESAAQKDDQILRTSLSFLLGKPRKEGDLKKQAAEIKKGFLS